MRSILIAAMLLLPMFGYNLADTTLAQSSSRLGMGAGKFQAAGILKQQGALRNGSPRFALYDQNNVLTTHVVPVAGIDLNGLIGRRVVVTARAVSYRDPNIPYVLTEDVRVDPSGNLPAAAPTPLVRAGDAGLVSHVESIGVTDKGTRIVPALGEQMVGGPEVIGGPPGMPMPTITGDPGMAVGSGMPYGLNGAACPNCYGQQGVTGYGGNCGPACGQGQGCNPGPCGMEGYTWIRAEYLYWWTKGMNLPPLVTRGVDQDIEDAGVLAEPGTEVIFGNSTAIDKGRSGGRLILGMWLDQYRQKGIEADYSFLRKRSEDFSASSDGSTILARPFTNVLLGGAQDSQLVAYPGVVSGTVSSGVEGDWQSGGIRFRRNFCCHKLSPDPCSQCRICMLPCGIRWDWIAGYRYARLREGLFVREDLSADVDDVVTDFDILDSFNTTNTFHGGELGMVWESYRGPWYLTMTGKLGLGNTRQKLTIDGMTTSVANGVQVTDTGGLLALPSNIGQYTSDKFTILPEFSATLGLYLTQRLSVTMGYTFVYWNHVVRAADAVDLNVNPNLIPPTVADPGPLQPAVVFQDTDFWAQGVNLGLDYRW